MQGHEGKNKKAGVALRGRGMGEDETVPSDGEL